jgi:hypothetical protein
MPSSDVSDVTATPERFHQDVDQRSLSVYTNAAGAEAEEIAPENVYHHDTTEDEKDHHVRELSVSPVPDLPVTKPVEVVDGCGSGSLLLVPRPSTSPDDPLNWSWMKKHAVLLALIPGCLLTDWTLTWGTTVFEMQAPEW